MGGVCVRVCSFANQFCGKVLWLFKQWQASKDATLLVLKSGMKLNVFVVLK